MSLSVHSPQTNVPRKLRIPKRSTIKDLRTRESCICDLSLYSFTRGLWWAYNLGDVGVKVKRGCDVTERGVVVGCGWGTGRSLKPDVYIRVNALLTERGTCNNVIEATRLVTTLTEDLPVTSLETMPRKLDQTQTLGPGWARLSLVSSPKILTSEVHSSNFKVHSDFLGMSRNLEIFHGNLRKDIWKKPN